MTGTPLLLTFLLTSLSVLLLILTVLTAETLLIRTDMACKVQPNERMYGSPVAVRVLRLVPLGYGGGPA